MDVFQVVKALRIQKPGSVLTVVSMSNLHIHCIQPGGSLYICITNNLCKVQDSYTQVLYRRNVLGINYVSD